ncbi:hypothetical protein JG688_00002510 [Phytophthora aleatoria]|uniref:Uncharacterized protein n=1 Tax=Phytophthora aleatoria TaxID=2496075 RepID=A0A8J5IV78_9STRA|nr:hypothetical protein JG688_00002510 [Phytophthora aleatoria]
MVPGGMSKKRPVKDSVPGDMKNADALFAAQLQATTNGLKLGYSSTRWCGEGRGYGEDRAVCWNVQTHSVWENVAGARAVREV